MPRAATNAKKPKHDDLPIPPTERDDDDDEFDPEDLELADAASELQNVDGASVTVYRQGAHGRDLTFIDTMPPANFSMPMLKHPPYNGGKFRVMMRKGRYITLNRLVQVEPAPRAPEPAAPAPVVMPQNNEAFVLIAKAMTDGFSRLGELIVANRPEPPKPRSTQEILNELTMMKQLFDRPMPQSDPVETITKLLGVMNELPTRPGGDGGEPGPMAVLLELARTFGPKLMEAQAMAEAQGAPPQLPPSVAAPMPPQPNPQAAPQPRRTDVQAIIAQQLRFLLKQAQTNTDPEPYAVVILDNVPQAILQSFLGKPDWFAEVCRYVPEAQPHRAWFDALKVHIDEYLTPEPEGEQTVAGNPDGGVQNGDPAAGDSAIQH